MSTRANILITAKDETPLWFYRHSDGYPEGAMPLLAKFMTWLKAGRIRDNIGQAAGWLVVLGYQEYRDRASRPIGADGYDPLKYYGDKPFEPGQAKGDSAAMGWKVGAIEPTTWGEHSDIEYRYTIDLTAQTLLCEKVEGGYTDWQTKKEIPKTYKKVSVAKWLK